MEEELEEFRKSSRNFSGTVFCAKCGSTNLDQNFPYQLRCYNCGTISIWDATRFSISRRNCENDVIDGIRFAAQAPKPDDGSWKLAILTELLPFLHDLTELHGYAHEGGDQIARSDFAKLAESWSTARTAVDAVLENLVSREDGIYDPKN